MRNAFLIGERVYLRAIEEADADVCYEWISDADVRRNLGRGHRPNTARSSREYIAGADGVSRQMFAIVTHPDDVYIGNVELFDVSAVHRTAEIGIVIGRAEHRGRGHGREAMRLLLGHAFRTLNLHKVYLRVYETNERGLKTYGALGFQSEGRLRQQVFVDGRYIDELRMGLLANEFKL
jgi:RimJ/RimL family protein N-acetyltransferase